jgi:hypothetical protein
MTAFFGRYRSVRRCFRNDAQFNCIVAVKFSRRVDRRGPMTLHSAPMLELHQRAAWMANEPTVAWHHFLRSRFAGRLPAREGGAEMAVVVQTVVQQSPTHAELRGCMEYGPSFSPVVFDFVASLDLETRELVVREPHPNPQPERTYSGQFSENGRVMTLHAALPGGRTSKPIHLIHEATLADLT